MAFLRIQLPNRDDMLACRIATSVFRKDIRNLGDIADRVIQEGYDWCIANRDPHKPKAWWMAVRDIHENFSWEKLHECDPITAKVHAGSLEFGSIDGFGGGCHRAIALAAIMLSTPDAYRPFDILLYCP